MTIGLLLRHVADGDASIRVRGMLGPVTEGEEHSELIRALFPAAPIRLPAWLEHVQCIALSETGLILHPIDVSAHAPWQPLGELRDEQLVGWWSDVCARVSDEGYGRDVVAKLHELYLGCIDVDVHVPRGSSVSLGPDASAANNLLVALASVMPKSWDLEDLPDDADLPALVPVAMVAGLSGLVFEAEVSREAWEAGQLPLDGSDVLAEHFRIDTAPRSTRPERPMVRVEQRASGFYFTFLDDQGQARHRGDDWHEIEVRRWHGPSQTHDPVVARRDRINLQLRSDLHVVDTMGVTELVGQQLGWQFSLVNVHGRVVLEAAAMDVRERLDRPAAVEAAQVIWQVGSPNATLDLWLPESDEGYAESDKGYAKGQLRVCVYCERRPLDACGYYGDADDLALLEGMRALDFDASESRESLAESDENDEAAWYDWLVHNEAWDPKWARLGLERVPDGLVTLSPVAESDPSDPDKQLGPSHQLTLDLGQLMPRREGVRLHVVIERRTGSGRVLESVPTPATHVLEFPAEPGGAAPRINVFQLERVEQRDASQPRFLRALERGSNEPELGTVLSGAVDPVKQSVVLRWRHVPPVERGQDELLVGGYRLWLRDPVAIEDPSPWRPVLEVQALSGLLASLRPLPGLGDARWLIALGGAQPPVPPQPVATDKVLGQLEAAVVKAQELGLQPLDVGPAVDSKLEDAASELLERLRLAFAELKEGAQHSQHASWHAAMLAVLNAQALIRRFRVPLSALGRSDKLVELLEQLATESPSSVVWMHARDPLRHPYSTVFAIGMVQRGAEPSKQWAPLLANRVLVLDELRGSHVILAWNEQRRLELEWAGIDDRWHHDLHWAVEVRDRYVQIRERMSAKTEAKADVDDHESTLSTVEPGAILMLPVLRSEPIVGRVHVIPELAPEDDWLVFRALAPPAWERNNHNAVVRTRLGVLKIDKERQQSWPRAERYKQVLGAVAFDGRWTDVVNEFLDAPPWSAKLPWPIDEHASRTAQLSRLHHSFRRTPPEREPSVLDTSILIFDRNTPYFYAVDVGAKLLADDCASETSWASTSRGPRGLGLPEVPKWNIRELERGKPTHHYELEFRLITPLLASHLDAGERDEIGSSETTVGHWLAGAAPVGFQDCPISWLPDLDLELQLFLDLSGQKANDPVPNPALLPLACWRGPLWHGSPLHDPAVALGAPGTDDPLRFGFHLDPTGFAPFLHSPVIEHANGMATVIRVLTKNSTELTDEIASVLSEATGTERFNPGWARLRRGARWTPPFQLIRKDGDQPLLGWS